MKRALAAVLLALAAGAAAATAPGDSAYQLDLRLTTQDGQTAALDLHRGHPVLVTMFYASCPHVCPMLIASLRHTEQQLEPAQRGRLRALLVSLDPARDGPAELKALAQRHRADLSRWTFARALEPDVRKLAAVLGVRYRRLPDGEFNHSTVVALLGPDGRILATTSQPTRPEPEFLQALRAAAKAP